MAFGALLHPQNRETGKKLGIATALMFTIPIIGFYLGMWYFAEKKHPENWAGGIAIVLTNVIVGGYCYSALTEEDEFESKAPRIGKFKQRTDQIRYMLNAKTIYFISHRDYEALRQQVVHRCWLHNGKDLVISYSRDVQVR